METISKEEIIQRIHTENPWWKSGSINDSYRELKPRAYFNLFIPLVRESTVRRAIVLMGPRRVGKTVMIHHTIQALLQDGVSPTLICYFSVDHPIYNGLGLEQLLSYYRQASGASSTSGKLYLFFDEIQYLRRWEVHLKAIVDTYPNLKCIASGSAAAALRLKSEESGAGRFTDFLLPPLTFYEYLDLLDKTNLFNLSINGDSGRNIFTTDNLEEVNKHFISYLNFGGYPEVIFSPQIQADPSRFIKNDIIDKVLLRDLPSLYGIEDIQELNHLFTTLAFNTANEVSLGELSKNSGVAKNTIKRYINYLEAAFLIKSIHRIDQSAKRFHRANYFKIYLTNPSMRAALFSPLKADDLAIGPLTETAVFSQWFHGSSTLYYARWQPGGEVDIVVLGPNQKVAWAVEVKWSDHFCKNPRDLKSLISFCHTNKLKNVLVTSRTQTVICEEEEIAIEFIPASAYCYTVGYNLIHGKSLIHEKS